MSTSRYDIRWCENCDKRPIDCTGLCKACYRWRQHRGTARPSRLWPAAREINFCKCGNVAHRNGLCWACDAYKRKRGRARPEKFVNRPIVCVTCGTQLVPCNRRHGECEACWSYRKYYRAKHGISVTRPAQLWGCDPALGWCECGRAAVERRTVNVPGGHSFSLGYCSECLEMIV